MDVAIKFSDYHWQFGAVFLFETLVCCHKLNAITDNLLHFVLPPSLYCIKTDRCAYTCPDFIFCLGTRSISLPLAPALVGNVEKTTSEFGALLKSSEIS